MTSIHSKSRKGRVFPEKRLSREQIEQRQAEDSAFLKRCRTIFDRVQPELIKSHYDWYIVIEPDRGDYVL